ncbi:MAG TPA: hypothetical protein VGW37_04585 [Terriglobia bacterium]|nr:hypothetical protein [Terriglobia bacterium]
MRKTKSNILILLSALTLTFFCAQAKAALQPGQQAQGEHATKQDEAQNFNNYRVTYKVNEVENAKTINSRTYTLMAKIGPTATLRIGSRVPYSSGGNQAGSVQYQDVGMNIDCKLDNSGDEGKLIVHTKVSMMSLQGKGTETSSEPYPVFGNFQVESFTVATLGKPAFVGSADDVNSNRRFVVEVTVTKAE